jgi:hypothetical protein
LLTVLCVSLFFGNRESLQDCFKLAVHDAHFSKYFGQLTIIAWALWSAFSTLWTIKAAVWSTVKAAVKSTVTTAVIAEGALLWVSWTIILVFIASETVATENWLATIRLEWNFAGLVTRATDSLVHLHGA